MRRFKVGIQIRQQGATIDELRATWRALDDLGVDAIYIWDHFRPLWGDPDQHHFEGYSLLGAMAIETSNASIGALVTCILYRNPSLLADMARTLDHLSGGRFILGLGAGWNQPEFEDYGYHFGTAKERLLALDEAIPVIRDRFSKLHPPPIGPMPILIGGSGEKIMLRLVAEYADSWNAFGPPDAYAAKNGVLDDWCARVGRDPSTIERTVALTEWSQLPLVDELLAAGASNVIACVDHPFDLAPVRELLAMAGVN